MVLAPNDVVIHDTTYSDEAVYRLVQLLQPIVCKNTNLYHTRPNPESPTFSDDLVSLVNVHVVPRHTTMTQSEFSVRHCQNPHCSDPDSL